MLGVTVLILVIAVMTGFDRELRQKVIDFDAHILVTSEDVLRDWRALKGKSIRRQAWSPPRLLCRDR